jgi:hypothetical protein
MESIKLTAYSKLTSSLHVLETAHQAVKDGVATHAEKREVEMNALRGKLRRESAIQSGIERATGQI